MYLKASVIARDYVVDGVEASGIHEIAKSDLRAWMAFQEAFNPLPFPTGRGYENLAELEADLSPPDKTVSLVVLDPTPGINGLYRKSGDANVGGWTQLLDYIPGSQIVTANDDATGTVNAVRLTSDLPLGSDGKQLVVCNVNATNTTSPVTVQFNLGDIYTVKTVSGSDVPVNGLTLSFIGTIKGATFVLISDIASSSQITLAAAYAAEAKTYRDAALVSSAVYATEALGNAAVADGSYFKVIGTLNGNTATFIYKRVSVGVSTLETALPTESLVQRLRGTVQLLRASSTWNPSHLFRDGEKGFYFDLDETQTCFTDVAGTIVAVPGNTVQLVLDLSGNNNHATQAVTINAPTLRQTVDGHRWLDFTPDANNKWLSTAKDGQPAQWGMWAFVKPKTTPSATQYSIISGRSAAAAGFALLCNTKPIMSTSGTGAATALIEFPGEALEANETALLFGGYDGTNLRGRFDDFWGLEVASSYGSPNSTPGVFIGRPKYLNAASAPHWMNKIVMVERTHTGRDTKGFYDFIKPLPAKQGDGVSSLSFLRSLIEGETVNPQILIISDSTGDAKNEFIGKIASNITALYPRMGVSYRLFDYVTNAWTAASVVQASSNGITLTIHNTARSLSMPRKMMADRYTNAVASIPEPHLLVINHGHNVTATNLTETIGEHLAAIEQVRGTWPNVRVVAMLQNPTLLGGDTSQTVDWEAYKAIFEGWRELQIIDAGARFKALGFSGDYYADAATSALHPSERGSQIIADLFMEVYRDSGVVAGAAGAIFLAATGTNRLINGNFAAFTGAVPDDWTSNAGVTVTKDLVVVDGAGAYSVRLETGNGYLSQTLTGAALDVFDATNFASLFGRARSTEGEAASAEIRVIVTAPSISGGSASYSTKGTVNQGGAFYHHMLTQIPVPADTTSVEVRLYSAASAGARTSWFSKVVLVEGKWPKEMV